jgi:4-hydroxymandelate oxidase
VILPPLTRHLGLDELQAAAAAVLPVGSAEFLETGARGELTVRANVAAWSSWWLRPRVLVDVAEVSTASTVLDLPVRVPILVAPMSLQRVAHPDGESGVARAVAAREGLMIVSMGTSTPIEELAAILGRRWWMQLYLLSDRDLTASIARRAASLGAGALVLTVDAPRVGTQSRPRDGFRYPDGVSDVLVDPTAWTIGSDRRLTWDEVHWLQDQVDIPVILKGILHPDDAARAADDGVRAIVVSNHGGRVLDGTLPTALALPAVTEAVGGRLEVYVDGGIRRGADVLRALALGARAVLLGRPVLWGLALGGSEGAGEVLDLLAEELDTDAALCGVADVAQVPHDLVERI